MDGTNSKEFAMVSMKTCMIEMIEQKKILIAQGWEPYADKPQTLVSEDGNDEVTFKCKMKT